MKLYMNLNKFREGLDRDKWKSDNLKGFDGKVEGNMQG